VDIPRRPYRSDVCDAQWALIEPTVTAWRQARGRLAFVTPKHDLREIVNAIMYVNRTGIAWEYLPHDFPPHKTVYDYYAKWEADGTTAAMHDLLREDLRAKKGHTPSPSAALVDSQSVKTSTNVPEGCQGIDANKKIKGRKRHIATDVLGLVLAVVVTAASIFDTAGGTVLLKTVAQAHSSVRRAWVDAGYQQGAIDTGATHGITVQVVSKKLDQQGFTPLRKRWAVERTFGWFMFHRRLVRDYETLPQRSITQMH
jgi:transposase